MQKKIIWLFSLIGIGILMIGILSWIFWKTRIDQTQRFESLQKYFAIVPHFTIQPQTIENFYQFLQKAYMIKKNESINIVVVSPDHFNASKNNSDMLCNDTKHLCFQNTCVEAKKLPSTKTSGCLDVNITKEHGIGAQFAFIKKTFPNANIFPIVIKPRKFIDDTEIIDMLSTYHFVGKTLLVASVDFSHYTDEDFAQLHDKKSLYSLNNATNVWQYGSLEVDCPSCLYIINTLAQKNNQYPKLFLRDSSSTIVGKNLGTGNTSREFIYYTGQKQQENWFTVAFFGDLIFDRQVATKLSWEQSINEYFKTFFQKKDTKLSPILYPHRKLFGIDFVGLNLETPIVSNEKICQKTGKEVAFCSSNSILPYLKNIGFTLMNIANNHSLDWGILALKETVQQLKNNKINYIGHIRSGPYFEQDYTYKTIVRGIKIARQWYDFTITPRYLFSWYCANLQKNKKDGYINMVSVHRWTEYQTIHNIQQESLGMQLIDCWADTIIGHHPHVLQDIGRYKGKPIIYSLGNFLFDMKNPPETKRGGYVLIDYQNNWKITIGTGTIHASIY